MHVYVYIFGESVGAIDGQIYFMYKLQLSLRISEINRKSEEIVNFYLIVLYNLIAFFIRIPIFCFNKIHFQLLGLFEWGHTRTNLFPCPRIGSVSRQYYPPDIR